MKASLKGRGRVVGLTAGLMAGLVLFAPDASPAERGAGSYTNTAPEVSYVGSKACTGCHKEISADYPNHAMGRSMVLPSAAEQLNLVETRVTIKHPKSNRYFEVFREGSDLFQAEYELGLDGKEVFRRTYKLEYVVGSGTHGFSYLVRRENYLFQAPLSYYTRAAKWELSPGYETAAFGFDRPIRTSCLTCHAGRAAPVPDRIGLYQDPPFQEMAIGCENCHGPGERHVNARLQTLKVSGPIDYTIVNPANAPPQLGEDICMRCHQWGDTRALLPDKTHFDFRPGTPLIDSLAILKTPHEPGSLQEKDLMEHHFAMKLSRCFRVSGGKLTCFSCHEIHARPDAASKVGYYRRKCLHCHNDDSCGLALEQRRNKSPGNDCLGCHMPKRDIGRRIRHTAMTNHRIVARLDQPLPQAAYEPATPGLPGLVLFNRPAGAKEVHFPPRTLLLAYGDLAGKYIEYRDRYLGLLDKLAEGDPTDPVVLAALGRKAKLESTAEGNAQAIEHLSKALESGVTAASAYRDLGEVLVRVGRNEEALEIVKKGLDLAPFDRMLSRLLTGAYIDLQRYAEAEAALRRHVELFPSDTVMRDLLQQVDAANAEP